MGSSEAIYGDGQLYHLAPARAVIVVQDEGAIFTGVWLPTAQTDAVLRGKIARHTVFTEIYNRMCGSKIDKQIDDDVSYFECVPVSIEHIQSDLNVLLDALATSLELPSLQGQVQVITCVTYRDEKYIYSTFTQLFSMSLYFFLILSYILSPFWPQCQYLKHSKDISRHSQTRIIKTSPALAD